LRTGKHHLATNVAFKHLKDSNRTQFEIQILLCRTLSPPSRSHPLRYFMYRLGAAPARHRRLQSSSTTALARALRATHVWRRQVSCLRRWRRLSWHSRRTTPAHWSSCCATSCPCRKPIRGNVPRSDAQRIYARSHVNGIDNLLLVECKYVPKLT
jgi:hypothetical protein